ncbi:hypothetical protein B0H14DRAFT_2583745 [Mycena olivaceomarginata]|nr:hypothetical protein B0H14DRAFT_2583745 [Mycena olivaceomarginata]
MPMHAILGWVGRAAQEEWSRGERSRGMLCGGIEPFRRMDAASGSGSVGGCVTPKDECSRRAQHEPAASPALLSAAAPDGCGKWRERWCNANDGGTMAHGQRLQGAAWMSYTDAHLHSGEQPQAGVGHLVSAKKHAGSPWLHWWKVQPNAPVPHRSIGHEQRDCARQQQQNPNTVQQRGAEQEQYGADLQHRARHIPAPRAGAAAPFPARCTSKREVGAGGGTAEPQGAMPASCCACARSGWWHDAPVSYSWSTLP